MIKNFAQLETKMANMAKKPTIVLAGNADDASMEALRLANEKWGVNHVLGGTAEEAVQLIKDGKGSVLMKGGLPTGELLKAVVDKQKGIGLGGLMSHLGAFQTPNYHKLMFVTDGGMVTNPDMEQKANILKNALGFLRSVGYEQPKTAMLCAVETVSDKMQETVDAQKIAKRAKEGEFGSCIVEGPIAFDLAVSKKSAQLKGFDSEIAGETDLFIAPNIASGNILGKSLIYMGQAVMAGCVLGARVPIVLVSRGASTEEKVASMALALAVE
ncbi:MAG: phosphate acyltransferase [Defluviitaleaceae bacterium]|nr:phosphate acyltransferase [Defluviitaleaceae bacterium]